MIDGCDFREATATINMSFEVCKDHGHTRPTSGYVSMEGVDIDEVVGAALSAMEQALSKFVDTYPPVQEAIKKDYPDIGVLPERAQEHIMKLVSHQYLLAKVAARDYRVNLISGFMTL